MTANNSTNNNVMILILDQNVFYMREKNILGHYLFGDKIIQNCLKIDAPY